ncbi:MAG TPA: hypothetical protein H9935_07435 [Candidatus Blautia merdigallinarum]|uniref:Uncharacterized protein n=1 Tax=Candidatus Blautia merdigallinarum TaxID=2838495 RepID=A0A9D2SKQ6_9FIRM|nr:hypothetical protein [Candidatus Blautia merdigallinarum]
MGYFEDDILKMYENIPREAKKKDAEKNGNKETLNKPLNLSFSDELLKSFETIPRKEKVSREDTAIADIKELVQYLEKQVKGTLQETDKQKIRQKKEEYKKSLEILSGVLLKKPET